jgi:hypothetical protein
MLEFKVGEHSYSSGKMDPFGQLHVARKLAPLLTKLAPQVSADGEPPTQQTTMQLLAPISEALSEMSEEDVNYVLHRCLAVVRRLQGTDVWAPIWNVRAKALTFEDIDVGEMLTITMQVLGDNLGNFMQGRVSPSPPLSPGTIENPGNLSPFPTAKTG